MPTTADTLGFDPALLDLYSARMKALGETVKDDHSLDTATATVQRRSPLCGSQVTFGLRLDPTDPTRLGAIGWKARCCALALAATGIVVAAAPGSTLDELEEVREAVRAMLKGKVEALPLPGGKWADLEILRPAALVPSRHGSALLPFETVIAAMKQALEPDS